MKISFAMLTHNEGPLLEHLLNYLQDYQTEDTEIVIIDDCSQAPTKAIIAKYPRVRVFERPLAQNFAAQRNFLKSHCRGDFIFLFDPDETPPKSVFEDLPALLTFMQAHQLDACAFPRINLVTDMQNQSYVNKRITKNDRGWFGFPDYQMRLIRNVSYLRWRFRVHEHLTGLRRVYYFPPEEKYAFVHEKQLTHIQNQDVLYKSIPFNFWRKLAKSLRKRLGLSRFERIIASPPC